MNSNKKVRSETLARRVKPSPDDWHPSRPDGCVDVSLNRLRIWEKGALVTEEVFIVAGGIDNYSLEKSFPSVEQGEEAFRNLPDILRQEALLAEGYTEGG